MYIKNILKKIKINKIKLREDSSSQIDFHGINFIHNMFNPKEQKVYACKNFNIIN